MDPNDRLPDYNPDKEYGKVEEEEEELSDPRVAEALTKENSGRLDQRLWAIFDRWWDTLLRKAGIEEKKE